MKGVVVSESIAVGVCVEGNGICCIFIGITITVIVEIVAGFCCAWVDGIVAVVAVIGR